MNSWLGLYAVWMTVVFVLYVLQVRRERRHLLKRIDDICTLADQARAVNDERAAQLGRYMRAFGEVYGAGGVKGPAA